MDETSGEGPADAGAGGPELRFEATIHPGEVPVGFAAVEGHVADLDLDRIPDPDGDVRVLVDAADCTQLLSQGFEVRLLRAVPVRPLDPSLIADDDEVRAWLHARVRDAGGSGTS